MIEVDIVLIHFQRFRAVLLILYYFVGRDAFDAEIHIDGNEVLFGVEGKEVSVFKKVVGDLRNLAFFVVLACTSYCQFSIQNYD